MDAIGNRTRHRLPEGHLYRPPNSDVYRARWKYRHVQYTRSLETHKKAEAEEKLRQFMVRVKASILDGTFTEEYGRTEPPPVPENDIHLSEAWKRYLECTNRPDSGKETLAQYAYQFSAFVEWMHESHRDVVTVRGVTKEIARGYAAHLNGSMSPNTFNKYMNLLAMVFRCLNDNWDIVGTPWDGITRKRLDTVGKEPFSAQEISTILSKAKGDTLTICLLGMYTGLRFKDACLFEWADVDMDARLIRCYPFKTKRRTGRAARILIFQPLHDHLSELKRNATSKHVCPEMAEVYIRSHGASASRRFQEFLTKCGIRTQEGKATVKGFHSFRHFFATKAKEAGVDQAALREILGWSSSAMERVYSHVGDEYVVSSMRKMEGVMNGQSPQKNGSPPQVSSLSDEQLSAQLAAIQAELERRRK